MFLNIIKSMEDNKREKEKLVNARVKRWSQKLCYDRKLKFVQDDVMCSKDTLDL